MRTTMGLRGITHHVVKEVPYAARDHLVIVYYACNRSRRVKYGQVRDDRIVDCMTCLVKGAP